MTASTRNPWTLILILLLSVGLARSQSGSNQPSATNAQIGKVVGTVFDENDARVENAGVTFVGDTHREIVRTNSEGEYEADLPAGVYKIEAEGFTFSPYKRASFRVLPGQVRTINIEVKPGPLNLESVGDIPVKSPHRPDLPQKYQALYVGRTSSNPGEEVVIEFVHRIVRSNYIEFTDATVIMILFRYPPRLFV